VVERERRKEGGSWLLNGRRGGSKDASVAQRRRGAVGVREWFLALRGL